MVREEVAVKYSASNLIEEVASCLFSCFLRERNKGMRNIPSTTAAASAARKIFSLGTKERVSSSPRTVSAFLRMAKLCQLVDNFL